MTAIQRLMLLLVRAYQLALSPFAGGACRFHPSCSEYALDAIALHGAVHGSWLTLRRITRCHPWSHPGLDPVPPARREGASGAPADSRAGRSEAVRAGAGGSVGA